MNIQEKIIADIQKTLDLEREHLKVHRILLIELEPWDARKINKRIGDLVQARLPNYNVYYNVDKPYWINLECRMKGDMNRDKNWKWQIHYFNDGDKFKFDAFMERNPIEYIYQHISDCENWIANPTLIEQVIDAVVDFRSALEVLTATMNGNKNLAHKLPDRVSKAVHEASFLIGSLKGFEDAQYN